MAGDFRHYQRYRKDLEKSLSVIDEVITELIVSLNKLEKGRGGKGDYYDMVWNKRELLKQMDTAMGLSNMLFGLIRGFLKDLDPKMGAFTPPEELSHDILASIRKRVDKVSDLDHRMKKTLSLTDIIKARG